MTRPPLTTSRPVSRMAPGRIGPDDPRFDELVRRGFNKRFTARPDAIVLVGSTEDVVEAVRAAVADGTRFAVRSGGHCLEGFVADPAVRLVIDTSLMAGVGFDLDMGAFAVEAGTTLGEMYRRLYLGWGVTLPAGESPAIGVGGHVSGGAFGFLCRQHGLAADHLHAVEVVVVDASGDVRAVIATRDPSDPNHDLWWAHTGAGGGNFGVVTRCWLRSPGVRGNDPRTLLPRAPESTLAFRATWKWDDVDAPAFARLAHNFGAWCQRHHAADSPFRDLYSMLFLRRRQTGTLGMIGVCTAGADAERRVQEHLAAVNDGVGASCETSLERRSWLALASDPFPEMFRAGIEEARAKVKDAFLRRPFSDRQVGVVYDYLTRTDHDVMGGALGMVAYGCRVNTVAPDATASPQRDSILSTACSVGWGSPGDEAAALAWVRAFYAELFAETGGVPAPGGACDGAMINHPDADLADPEWNPSGIPWHAFYYKENYPRLQRVKARWDPRDVFRHALSIRA